MGQAESVPSGSPGQTVGYHVVQVQPHSPGAKAGLVSFFDFIVAANNTPLVEEDETFKRILTENVDQPVTLRVFNSRDERVRETRLTPTRAWPGDGLVGISIRFCNFAAVRELVWHVLDVYPRSPAVDAGLEARSDYIVGTPDQQFTDGEDFFTYVELHMRQPIRLYVYSAATDAVRLVTITPNDQWGGHGVLGCDVGYGYLHRIPKQAGAAPAGSSEASADAFTLPPPGERRLHPLMIPSGDGYQTPPSTPAAATSATGDTVSSTTGADSAVAPAAQEPEPVPVAAAPTAATAASTAPRAQQNGAADVLSGAPAAALAQQRQPEPKADPGPPPSTPYVGAPKAAPKEQKPPPTSFVPLGVNTVPSTSATAPSSAPHARTDTLSPNGQHEQFAAPAQDMPPSAAPFQMPPDADGGFSSIPL